MKTKPASNPTPDPSAPVAPLASYMAAFEQWMQRSGRCQNSAEAEDIRQEIRLALWESKDVPATRDEARLVFLRLASRFESRARRQVVRQGALVEQPEELAEAIERDAVRSLALFNALERLSDHERWLVKECKVEERSHAEVAQQLGVSDHTVGNRLWRAMTKLIAILKDEEKKLEKSQKSLGLIAPLAFEFTETQRAAFHAIWTAEGRIPMFGEGPPGPPNPPGSPSVLPGVPPVAVAPIVFAGAGGAVSAVAVAIVLVLLAVVPMSIVAIYYFWDPPVVQTANKGLRTPTASVIEDVDPVVPLHETPVVQVTPAPILDHVAPPAPTSSSPYKSTRTKDAPESSPPIDPEELERARQRRPPRFLPRP